MSQPSTHQPSHQPPFAQPPQTPPPLPPQPQVPTPENARPRRKKLRLVLILIAALLGSFIVYALARPERGSVATRSAGDTTASGAQTPASLAPGETQTSSALDLRAGDCYNNEDLPPADGSTVRISSVELTSCDSTHTAQVITKVAYKITDNYEDIRANQAPLDCDQQVRAKVQPGILADTAYQLVIISPADQASWTHSPAIACVLLSAAPHVGSALIA